MARVADHPIDPIFTARWSPRAMSGELISEAEIMQLLEAARWAPSSTNSQPWRFVYAIGGTPTWKALHGTLAEGNRSWCERAGAFIVIGSVTAKPDGAPILLHAFDSGAAWMSLALQAAKMGLVVHGMQGFNAAQAHPIVHAPANVVLHCVAAVGRPGRVEDLTESQRAREMPNARHPVTSFSYRDRFSA